MSTTVGAFLLDAAERLRASGSESARLDAELLLGHVLGIDRTGVLAHPEAPVSDGQEAAALAMVARRAAGEPVAYIRGVKEFFGLAFTVDPRALIPRPDTERLVELAIETVRQRLTMAPRPAGTPPLHIWDVGTGSGCIAVALAVSLRRLGCLQEVRLTISDLSRDALGVALENAVGHGVADRMHVALGDLLDAEPRPGPPIDLLLANLPYIPSSTIPTLPIAASFEPPVALDGGADGLAVIRRLLPELPAAMAPDGRTLLELGADQAEAVRAAAAAALPGWRLAVHHDLGHRPRVLQVDRPPTAG